MSLGFCVSISAHAYRISNGAEQYKAATVVECPCFGLSNGALVQSMAVVEHFTAEWSLVEKEEEEEEGVKVQ